MIDRFAAPRFDSPSVFASLLGNDGGGHFLFAPTHALARAGPLPQARCTFEKMHTYAHHVGLFAEEIGPSGEQLGNFPQAFTHLSLIMAATTLDEVLDRLVAH